MDTEDFQRGVTVPVIQSGCLFMLAGGLALGLALLKGWEKAWELALGAGCVMAGIWLVSRFAIYWSLYVEDRRMVYEVNSPALEIRDEPEHFELRLVSMDGRRQEFLDLPVDHERFRQLAEEIVLRGTAISEETLTGSGKLFSKDEWNQLRDEMVRRELLEWRSDRSRASGLRLTAKGYEVMRGMVSPTVA